MPLNALGPYNTYPSTYPVINWYDNGNFGTPIATGQNFAFPSTNSGNHQISVVVTNYNGCSDTAGVFCLNDNVCCQIVLDSIHKENALCPQLANGWFSILLSNSSVGGPFTITSIPVIAPFPTTITPGVPLLVSNVPAGTYIIKITDPTGSCMETYDVVIGNTQEGCCFARIDSVYHKILSNITYTSDMVWDDKYYVDDNVTVTVTNGAVLDITGVDVVFGECAGIVFINGGRLRANNSVFRPCAIDKTWKGLLFNGAGTFDNIVNTSTFKNAEVALYFQNQADAVISDNLFSNCNYGIRVEGITSFNHPISGNHFVTEDFFPNFSCKTKYSFITNLSTYGIYSTASRFMDQVSQNEFINSKGVNTPRTYGIYQNAGGGRFTENTFTDCYNSIWLQAQLYYSLIDNNEIETNQPQVGSFPCVYIGLCNGPVIEVNNNDVSNDYNQFVNQTAIMAISSTSVTIVNNNVSGFNYGIVGNLCTKYQISNNTVKNSTIYGIYVTELPTSHGYITCNSIKMRRLSSGSGFEGINMAAVSEVTSNCITDSYISMDFRKTSSSPVTLPKIRNNYLYNYYYVGINNTGCTGNIGTATSPGMNTLYSNKNTAVDINSNVAITVANNFGMFNISFPYVLITNNNPYYSTASCGHQIYSMPSQGNLNINYSCDNYLNLIQPLTGTTGIYKLGESYPDSLTNSSNQFIEANMILSCTDNADPDLLNQVIGYTSLSDNEKALLKFAYYLRNSDTQNARINMLHFAPVNSDEADYKTLMLYELDVIDQGWSVLTDNDVSILQGIMEKQSVYSNIAITLLNNTSTYRDHLIDEPLTFDVTATVNPKLTNGESYLNIYPNPATDKVFIEVLNNSAGNMLQVVDISGKLITEYSLNLVSGGFEMDIKNLSEGFYFITLSDPVSGVVQKGKLIKVNSKE
ncbi:MAG: T9SS type A sorting domain-containing protein [Bacteroidia bacterium]|nr:T9SS type A sorting domain-containing protein [Bacteroidia bacterium]